MKNAKSLLIAAFVGLVLISGQPHAVVAVQNTSSAGSGSSQPVITPDGFNGNGSDFAVDITFVGLDLFTELDPTETGGNVYEVTSSSGIANIRLQADISGWTCWGCSGNFTDDDYRAESDEVLPHFGQLFTVINGEVALLGAGFVGSSGLPITLGPGDNVLTLLYAGKDEVAGFTWASDTIIVRVSTDGTFPDVDLENIDVSLDASDAFDGIPTVRNYINPMPLSFNAFSGYSLDYTYKPKAELSATYSGADGGAINFDSINNFGVEAADSISFEGMFDTTGFDGEQIQGFDLDLLEHIPGDSAHEGTKGHVFWYDANGLTYVSDLSSSWQAAYFLSQNDNYAKTDMGFVVLSEYGRWDQGQDVFGASGADHGGLSSTTFYGDDALLEDDFSYLDDDGRYYYNMSALDPVDVEDGTFWYDTSMVEDMVAVEDGNYYYNTTLSGDMFENATGFVFNNGAGVTEINGSVVVGVEYNGDMYYNVTIGAPSVYNSSHYDSEINAFSDIWYNVELPELFYNDTVVEYVSWLNSTLYTTDSTGAIIYDGSEVSSIDVDGTTYYDFDNTGAELGTTVGTIDGVDYTLPGILDTVVVDTVTYYTVGVGDYEFAPLAPYYNDTVVDSVNVWENVTGFSYDNNMGATFINGSYVHEITFEGDWYSNATEAVTGTIPFVGGTNTVTINGTLYTDAMWPAPFYNDTQITYTDTFTNYQFVSFYGSFDFTTDTFGFTFGAAPYQAPVTTSIIDTSTQETTETTEAPGFTALVSMLTIGVIAYVAPRMRKKEN
jgi:hypothetical protein